jgi:hypothetical protein
LPIDADNVTLNNEKYDAYYVYNNTTGDLGTATLNTTDTVTPLLQNVLAYKSYGNNSVLYVTDKSAPKGKVLVKLRIGDNTYDIRDLPVSNNYLVDLTTYNGTLYLATGSSADNRVYIYKDPVGQISNFPTQAISPIWVLHVPNPNYLSFSDNAQFIIAENGYNYATYDIQNNLGYLYTNTTKPLDAPQLSASWMDGDRLTYVSNNKLIVQDYDDTNSQQLVSASANYIPAFSSDYRYLYTISPNLTSGQYELNLTPLLLP